MRNTTACLAVILLAATFSGCFWGSSSYVSVRSVPKNPLAGPLNLLARGGPKPTERTTQWLRRYDLDKAAGSNHDDVLAKMQEIVQSEPSHENYYALAEMSYIAGRKAETALQAGKALDHYGAAVIYAYTYLLDARFDSVRNPYDPEFRLACDVYNNSLESAMRLVQKKGELKPGATLRLKTPTQEIAVTIVNRGRWSEQDFERFEFASDYEVQGLKNHYHTYGLGVPLIAIRNKPHNPEPHEQFYPPGLSFPVTAFLRVLPNFPDANGNASAAPRCVLELYDPLISPDLAVARRTVPLETDLSTPLGHFLSSSSLKTDVATWGLLFPDAAKQATGLYMLEPYDPERIPVLMVHGLWSSPITWMEMFNDLRGDPEIRRNYQFWFYLYPTGQPFWVSAAQLRADLDKARATLDPERRSPALDQMVLVGHSMGGLVSRMQTLESGDEFWRIVTDKPFDELKASEEDRLRLRQMVYFQPNPSVRRVVTIGTPHRGSSFANDYTRWISAKLISLPEMLVSSRKRLIAENPGYFRKQEMLTINTSIDSLAPNSPVLPVMLTAPRAPWVQYHNIIGQVPRKGILGRVAGKSDGVVAYDSAAMDDVVSQIVVESDHTNVHRHPAAVLEVRRILREHLREANRERAWARSIQEEQTTRR